MAPTVSCGLGVIVIYQCRFISYQKCTSPVGDANKVGGYVCIRAGSKREISIPLLNFVVKLKLLQEN